MLRFWPIVTALLFSGCCARADHDHWSNSAPCCQPGAPVTVGCVPPTYEINLDLPPEQRWTEVGNDYKGAVFPLMAALSVWLTQTAHAIADVDSWKITPTCNSSAYDFGYDGASNSTEMHIVELLWCSIVERTPEYAKEIEGFADAMGIKLYAAVIGNVAFERFSTSVFAVDKHGKVWHGRNHEFADSADGGGDGVFAQLTRPLILQAQFTKGGVLMYEATTFAGVVSFFTFRKPDEYTFAIHKRYNNHSSAGNSIPIINNLLMLNDPDSQLVTMIGRTVADKTCGFGHATRYLSQQPLVAPVFFSMAGTKPYQAVVIGRARDPHELSRDESFRFLKKRHQHHGSGDHEQDEHEHIWYMVQTNYDYANGAVPNSDQVVIDHMETLPENKMDLYTMLDVMSINQTSSLNTVHTTVMRADCVGPYKVWIPASTGPSYPGRY